MPAGKSSQTNVMMYTVIIFVALFLIAMICAVIFYVKSENYKIQADNLAGEISDMATPAEQRSLSKIIGKPHSQKSYLGTMNAYLDSMVSAITGKLPEDTTAAVKVNGAVIEINETMEMLGEDVDATYGPEGIDLLQTIVGLKFKLDTANESARKMEQLKNNIQDEFDLAIENFRGEEQQLIAEKNRFQNEADRINASYEELKRLMEQSADEQILAYIDKLKKTESRLTQKNMELLKVQAQLNKTDESLQAALDKLESIKPRPDIEVRAFDPDAKVVSVDAQANVVYLDIGSKDHVYRGLAFAVFDKNVPMPRDGKPKAELEVFEVREKVSAARIVSSSKKNPVIPEDIVTNLIWDSETSNKFVVAGDFDFDHDGRIDHDGKDKIIQLVERWGGRIVKTVSIETDFIVLGTEPQEMTRPSREQIEADPVLEQKYNASLKRIADYNNILDQANTLSVPIFNQRRFFRLIGYETLARKSTPF